MPRIFLKFLLYFFAFVLIILFPFIIEKFIITFFALSSLTIFSKDTWFNFIASYLGTIGTILLGIIALYQNKKYKELSDKSEENFLKLQNDIKELIHQNVELINLNSKLEQAKYHPILSDCPGTWWNISEDIYNYFSEKDDVFQVNFSSPYYYEKPLNDILKDHCSFIYSLKNIGERPIRNFICKDAVYNFKDANHAPSGRCSLACDILPGNHIVCVHTAGCDLAELVMCGELQSVSFTYEMENVLGEKFETTHRFSFYESDDCPSYYEKIFSPIIRI